ncbi:hypothetical protein [Pseudarthrobacter sp. PS3-L1]|uniref:hypothetical protein n=1 Tax=Pseudarthrobacter sp. PS3-L1 TaxID=3046207 RepID=UPI0024BAFA32|nr:hypothetical protein [Pseudarthrobacter sp. PS3-L1]MDJ0321258.1 hypothetical protein [Pseudarthrobacter sp. PS3-L1]
MKQTAPKSGPSTPATAPVRVGTMVWGLLIVALAAIIIIGTLEPLSLNGTYVTIGLIIGAGVALVTGGLIAGKQRDNHSPTRKS